MAVTHLSRVRTMKWGGSLVTRTGTLCNRMHGSGDINCTEDEMDVTCKFCLPILRAKEHSFAIEIGAAR